ncbi:hypothetical protein BC941DRAFT_408327 [Chlamydoabsidia padenii]|nr:hypothetical protein BC941DRAFT_408327 [Chlamydoabsidia padenii]
MTLHQHFLSSDTILIQLCYHLSIRDIVILSQTCRDLNQRLFHESQVWEARQLIFQPQDKPWVIRPSVIRQLLPTLPRHHGLKKLMIHDIPDMMDVFLIFDHCAHSIEQLDLILSYSQCHQLCMHLEAFCFHLATCQAWNKIPLTLHQYTLDSNQLYHQAQQSLKSSSHQPFFINQLIAHGLPTRMDDPPFEMLKHISIHIQSPTTSQATPCDPMRLLSSSTLIQQFHHLMTLLSRHTLVLSSSRYTSDYPHTGTSTSGISIPDSAPPDLSVSSSLTSKSSSRINITSLIEKRQSDERKSIKRKKSRQQQSEKEQQYYHRIEQLSHQYRRSVSSSPPPSPPTPPPHRIDSFLPSSRRSTQAPIVHVMRCQRPRSKK